MNSRPIVILAGLPEELSLLELGEVVDHLGNHLGNFLLDARVARVYIQRLLQDQNLLQNQPASRALAYLSRKYLQLRPFSLEAVELAGHFNRDPSLQKRLKILAGLHRITREMEKISRLLAAENQERARNVLRTVLEDQPGNVVVADQLLDLDYAQGREAGSWMRRYQCPAPLKKAWEVRLFQHHADLRLDDRALPIWEAMEERQLAGEVALNGAAEMLVRTGEIDKAIELYAKSLERDHLQEPVRLRLKELESPTQKMEELVRDRKVAVYLYSYNKADMLGKTLESLSRSRIGKASITVLLNGCRDDSRQVIRNRRTLFPDNGFEIIDLPVNVGAPAARNWLIAQPGTWESDYVAFLDDDVEVQQDWLEWLLTCGEMHPNAAVAGGKVVFPGSPAMYQYLYKNIAVARENLLRFSLATPNGMFDCGSYDFIRPTMNVMGCCHVLRTSFLRDNPEFDLQFSPSQIDDIAHDVDYRLMGREVIYCGLVKTVHHQQSGVNYRAVDDLRKQGNVLGNDVKCYYKYLPHMDTLKGFSNRVEI